jgi:hypothetical protein
MGVRVIERAPQTRCYMCGNAQIMSVCHHCGQAMCREHTPPTDQHGLFLSAEFTDLNLQQTECREVPIHCEYCDHTVLKRGFLVIAAGALLLLASLFLSRDADRLLAIVGGLGCIALGIYARRQRSRLIRQSRPWLPVLPRFDRIKVHETLRGRVSLDPGGCYRVSIEPVAGQLEIATTFTKSERERLDCYRKKYRLAPTDAVPFHAGFAVPCGAAGFAFAKGQDFRTSSGFVIPLKATIADVPFLGDIVGPRAREWPVAHAYRLLDTPKDLTLPIRLVPSLAQERAQQVLELEIQWVAPSRTIDSLLIQQIKSLEINVPTAWGEVQTQSDSALISLIPNPSGHQLLRSIVWKNLRIDDIERAEGRRTCVIQFENTISLADHIRGRIEVLYKGVISGVEGIDLYFPLGGKRAQTVPASIQTTVSIDFDISLNGLRYQDVRTISKPKCPKAHQQQEACHFPDITPNHTTIIALTDALSQRDFSIQHVVENRPNTMRDADIFNRYWDIAGRCYDRVYPIDFHLILTGKEVDSSNHGHTSATFVTLTVQGTFASPSMEQQIEKVWEDLWDVICDALAPRAKAVGNSP